MIGGVIVVVGIIAMVMIHEAGHFVAAKAVGMKATEFFFGFGPRLWSVQRGETEYGIKALPLGGYVRIVGMNPYEDVDPADLGRTYREKPFWAKSVVVLAGVASHFVVAFVIFYVVVTMVGVGALIPTVSAVQATFGDGTPTPAAAGGLLPGDVVTSLDGVTIDSWGTLVDEIAARPGATVAIVVERDGAPMTLTVALAALDDEVGGKRGFLGVQPDRVTERENPLAGLVEAGVQLGDATAASLSGMWHLVTGLGDLVVGTIRGDADMLDDVRPASPIGLVRLGAETERFGLATTLQLVALVNVFVGLFNVLPVYPLDGGHFSVALYEKIRGRQADVRKLAPIAAAVVIFMILLGVLAIFLDITSPFRLQ